MVRQRIVETAARLFVPALLLVLVSPVPAARAQSGAYDGQVIQTVEFIGTKTLSDDTLEHYLLGPSNPGEERRLSLEALNRRIHDLWARELVDDVEVEIEPVAGGVKLIVKIVERPVLVSVEYVGVKRVTRTNISEKIDSERISVYENQSLKLGEMQRLKAAIENLYKEKGYRFAEVTYALEDVAPGQVRATFTIDEGDKVKINDIDFDGNTVWNDLRLRLTMRKTKESGLISRFTKKDIYNPANIEEDLEKVRELYRKAGYKDVLVGRPELDVVARRPEAATIEEQKRRLAVTIPVEEGERWRLGDIALEGNEVFSDELLLRQFEQPRGGWLRSKVVDDGLEKINNMYQSVGFIFAKVETELAEREGNVADVVVHIDESDQFRVGRMEFEGNNKTRDKVLRREFLVQEGTVMNMSALQSSLLKIRQLNYFALNEDDPIQFDFDTEAKTVDLKVQGEEAERTELQFGGGWSEFDGFFGQFALRTTNFLGRGETVGVSVQSGRERNLFDLEYSVPWFLDRPQSIGVRAFNQELDSRILVGVDFEQKFSGASVTYGRGIGAFQTASFTYSFADVTDTQSIIIDPDDPPITRRQDFTTSSLRPFWIRNTLDSRFEPSRGLRLTGSLEFAGSFLGGDSDFLRPQATFTWFKPVSRQPFRSSFGINAEIGYITEIGDSDLFPQQRFFLGGDNSVRGFRRRSIVLRNEAGMIIRDPIGFPMGGDSMVQVNVEYHVIAGGPFRVVFFGDLGGVFGEGETPDPGLLRYSAGVELRIAVPLFPAPLRFIYASNLDPLPDDQFESFDFSLSTSF